MDVLQPEDLTERPHDDQELNRDSDLSPSLFGHGRIVTEFKAGPGSCTNFGSGRVGHDPPGMAIMLRCEPELTAMCLPNK